MSLDQQIEAILFYKAAPVEKDFLLKTLNISNDELLESLTFLKSRLVSGVTRLLESDTAVELVLDTSFDGLIDGLRKEELNRDIGKAGAETLAIVMYKSPVSRAEIDRIRGVNSSYILRALETRGLVERSVKGQRSEFRPTTELFKFLGIPEKTNMPDYATVMDALDNFEKQQLVEND